MRDYLKGQGIELDGAGARNESAVQDLGGKLVERLAKLFMEPAPDMPSELLESLYIFRELDSPAGMDAIRQAAELEQIELELEPDATPLDVVLTAWLRARTLVETVHNRLEVYRPRSFQYFTTALSPVPSFPGPRPDQLLSLERQLDTFYQAWGRGMGARVLAFRDDPVWRFLVRHGAPCRREGAMRDNRPATIFYRPQCHDVLVYDLDRGEMGLNCCAERERRVLLRAFGRVLFGQADYFPGTAKYTLAPLVRQGRHCLACGDVPGIERVSLTEVEVQVEEEPRHRDIRKAGDIFRLVESGSFRWPRRVEDIRRATFEVKFWRAPRARRVTIVPCNRAIFGREEDSPLLERLMKARHFIDPEAMRAE